VARTLALLARRTPQLPESLCAALRYRFLLTKQAQSQQSGEQGRKAVLRSQLLREQARLAALFPFEILSHSPTTTSLSYTHSAVRTSPPQRRGSTAPDAGRAMASALLAEECKFAHLLQPIKDMAANWDINIASELEEYLVRRARGHPCAWARVAVPRRGQAGLLG